MATRRGFIRIVGSSAVVLAAGGTWFTMTREPKEALAPWALAGQGYEDPRLFALSYGILAPNPHNRQIIATKSGKPTVTHFIGGTGFTD